jgi:DNA-binding beta-propeller fold protein YncE
MKLLTTACTLALALLILACQSSKTAEETETVDSTEFATPVKLTMKWETDSVLTTCESVIYDKANDVLYVANINGDPSTKDGNGFISKVTLDGKVSELSWVKGIDAPKGMGIFNGKLYVTDIDRIHEIDIATGKISKTYPATGAQFLNDITVDDAGKVYASDTGGGAIYLIDGGTVSKWIENIASPNGLLAENNQLFVLGFESKTLSAIDIASKQITQKTDSIDNGDGIEAIGDGGYLASSWNGLVHYISSDFKRTLILDTSGEQVSAADIEYIAEKNLLLVPTFFKNKVVAYELSK